MYLFLFHLYFLWKHPSWGLLPIWNGFSLCEAFCSDAIWTLCNPLGFGFFFFYLFPICISPFEFVFQSKVFFLLVLSPVMDGNTISFQGNNIKCILGRLTFTKSLYFIFTYVNIVFGCRLLEYEERPPPSRFYL